MLPEKLIYVWLVVFTVISCGFLLWILNTLATSRIRTLFIAFLVPYIIWGESLLLVQLVGAHHPYSRFVSQLIFLCGGLFHGALGVFFLEFTSNSLWPRKVGMGLFFALIMVSTTSLLGFIEKGVIFTPQSGLYPEPGLLFPLFNLLILTWGAYYFLSIRSEYRRLERLTFVKVQLKFVVMPAICAIGTTIVTNVVIPGLGGTYALTPLAAFWLFLFLMSVGYTVTQGQKLLVRESAHVFEEIVGTLAMPSLHETADKFVRFLAPAVQAARSSAKDSIQQTNQSCLPLYQGKY
jgi:hypothetical protein